MMNNIESPSKDYLKVIERKLEQFKLETSSRDPDQTRPIDDDDDDETVPYEKYSQYRDEQEIIEREIMERKMGGNSSE